MVFCGIDWAEEPHDVCVVDAGGLEAVDHCPFRSGSSRNGMTVAASAGASKIV